MIDPPRESMVREVECEYVELGQPDGYVCRGRLFDGGRGGPGVLYLHGIQSHGGWFAGSADFLRRKGMTVLLPDRRGTGLNRQRWKRGVLGSGSAEARSDGSAEMKTGAPVWVSADELVEDVARQADWLCERTGQEQVAVIGVSWGAKPALVYAGRYPERVRSVTLVGPGLCPRVDVSLREKIAIGLEGVVQAERWHAIPLTEPELFTANGVMQEFIRGDSLMLREAPAKFFLASRRLDGLVRQGLGRVAAPVRLLLAERDRIIDNEATVALLRPLLRDAPGCKRGVKVYRGAHHTLEFEPETDEFFADLARLAGG